MASIYAGIDQKGYDNESKYLNSLINSGSAGQKAWAQNQMKELNANKPVAQPTQTSGNNATTGGIVNKPTNSQPAQTQTSTPASTGGTNAFVSPGSQVSDNGTRFHSWGENDQYKVKDYLSGNADLQYALKQWMKDNNTNVYDIEGYAKDLYGRVGTQRENGSVVTLDDVNKELDRLGLSDYNSQNVTHTAGGSLIPKNEFVTNKTGSFGGSNSEDSEWLSYGGQDYLVGGDSANFVDYVNGKTGNTTNLDFIFDDMANNPYAKEDANFAQMYQDALNQFNSSAGIQTPTTSVSYTGYADVDQFIDYVNSVNGFNQATNGTVGTSSDIWSEIKAMLQGGYESQQEFLANQRTQAEQNAENLMRQAFVNEKLQSDRVKEAMSAAGLGTTGAMQSAMLGVQNNYNNNVADIRSNLASMIANFDEQKLKALTDYMNKSTDYYYQIQNDDADRAMQNAKLYMQALEMDRAQEQQKWENQYRQQLMELENQQYKDQWDWEKQQYSDALKQQEFENSLAERELALKRQAASYYPTVDEVPVTDESGNGEITIDNSKTTGTESVAPTMTEEQLQKMVDDMLLQSQAGLEIVNGLNQAVTPQVPMTQEEYIKMLVQQAKGYYQ